MAKVQSFQGACPLSLVSRNFLLSARNAPIKTNHYTLPRLQDAKMKLTITHSSPMQNARARFCRHPTKAKKRVFRPVGSADATHSPETSVKLARCPTRHDDYLSVLIKAPPSISNERRSSPNKWYRKVLTCTNNLYRRICMLLHADMS